MKILMIGPASSASKNFGLGLATEQIASVLGTKSDLTIISPAAEKEIKPDTDKSHKQVKIEERLLSTRSIESSVVQIDITSRITPYFYHSEKATETQQESHSSSDIQEALKQYNDLVVEQAQSIPYDVIYAHDWLSIGAGLALKAKYNRPLVLHIHALDYDRTGKKTNSWQYQLEKEGMEKADRIIAVSNYHALIMQGEYGIAKEKIEVVHLAVEAKESSDYQSPFKEKIVLFAGRLSQQKGVFQFIEMAALLSKENHNLRYVVAGDGELSEQVVSRVHEKGLSNYFNFTGLLERADLLALMKESELLVMPSVSEPFGLVALEAAQQELPIVLSKNSGVSEILSDALIPETNSTEDFVNVIELVLNEDKRVMESVVENKKAAASRTWAQVGEQIIKFLAKADE